MPRIEIVPVTPLGQNCSLLWDETTGRAVVTDPGGDVPSILERIAANKLVVEAILLTHGHFDHAGGAAELRDRLRAMPGAEAVPLIGPDERDGFLLADLQETGMRFGILDGRNVTPDRYLSAGEFLDLAGCRLEVRHVPGHTPGHVVFVDADRRFALVGDTLFQGSVGRTDFPYGDGPMLIEAIRQQLLPLPDAMPILPGHGGSSTIGAEKRGNPFLR
ncbi:MBL fold metallo-hydrolase [Rhizosaccharibacter radicis]|uniref:MBL fold metallo-hydrolase n=1 Tax=Rhizosaccharibacter radicis TaxID=2782605 RepID=A0ABT1W2A0_9PROT|nr:MBL fold metallo-hydrolase [Acetobacteraceae bacterium KSS12]